MRILLLAVLLMLPAGDGLTGPRAERPADAPQFALRDIKGRTARLSDYRGKVVLINFWATWCAPCRAEMPGLVKLQREYKDRGLQVVGITYPPESRPRVRNFATKLRINYPILFGNIRVAGLYGVAEVLPVTVVVDRKGKIRDRILGILDAEEFDEKVKPLLE